MVGEVDIKTRQLAKGADKKNGLISDWAGAQVRWGGVRVNFGRRLEAEV